MRELVFGPMPEGATPQTHIASGPWCFSAREEFFPGWWEAVAPFAVGQATGAAQGSGAASQRLMCFPLPDDPFSTPPCSMPETARAANAEVSHLTRLFAQEISLAAKQGRNEPFWEMALGPWLLLAVHMLTERQQRVLDLVALYGHEPLVVPILPENCEFSFESTHDFMVHGVLDRDFNHYVFSRITEAVAPAQWQLRPLPTVAFSTTGRQNAPVPSRTPFTNLKGAIKKHLARILRELPFPLQKGFSPCTCLGLSLAALLNSGKEPDHSTPFAAYGSEPLPWMFDAPSLIRRTMPRPLQGPYPKVANSHNRLRGMTAAISQDDTYRLRLAAWREGGGRLFSIQHGANYGSLQCMGGSLYEYAQHAFASWGWKSHAPFSVRAIPLPHPALASLHRQGVIRKAERVARPNNNRFDTGALLLVGTEISPFSYRLKSRPLARQQVVYRSGKVDFLRALPSQITASTLYRPYFPVPGGLLDSAFVTAHVPGLRLCTGDLYPHLHTCRLLALDHYGTTMLHAYAANIPCLCFWNRQEWGMEPQTEAVLETLARAGMLCSSPAEAAERVASVWGNVEAWWYGEEAQEARELFCRQFANGTLADARDNLPPGKAALFACWFRALLQI